MKATQSNEPNDVEFIYQRYLQAFKKGAYNYIKEETDPISQETIPRKYFSGGMTFAMISTPLGMKGISALLSVITTNHEMLKSIAIAAKSSYLLANVNMTPLGIGLTVLGSAVAGAITQMAVSHYLGNKNSGIDDKTGLLNEKGFNIVFDNELSDQSRQGIHVMVVYLDLNNFKKINDYFGHDVGDEFLKMLAVAGKGRIRLKTDKFARLHGDEFAFLFRINPYSKEGISIKGFVEHLLGEVIQKVFSDKKESIFSALLALQEKYPAYEDFMHQLALQNNRSKESLMAEFSTLEEAIDAARKGRINFKGWVAEISAGGVELKLPGNFKLNEDIIKAIREQYLKTADKHMYEAKRNGTGQVRFMIETIKRSTSRLATKKDQSSFAMLTFKDPTAALRNLLDFPGTGSFLEQINKMIKGGQIIDNDGIKLSETKAVGFRTTAIALDKLFNNSPQTLDSLKRLIPQVSETNTEAELWKGLLQTGKKPANITWLEMAKLYEITWEISDDFDLQGFRNE